MSDRAAIGRRWRQRPAGASRNARSPREEATEEALATEGVLALRDDAPSAAARRLVLASLGLEAAPRGRSRGRRRGPGGRVAEGLALGLALGLVLVVLRALLG